MLPLMFLLVAAFILNVALTRALALQRAADCRAQGAWLCATPRLAGTTSSGHSLIGVLGRRDRLVAGAWLGQLIIGLYNQFFRFPVLLFRLSHRRRRSAPPF